MQNRTNFEQTGDFTHFYFGLSDGRGYFTNIFGQVQTLQVFQNGTFLTFGVGFDFANKCCIFRQFRIQFSQIFFFWPAVASI